MALDFNKLSDVNNNVQDVANELDALISADNDDLRNLIGTQITSLAEAVESLNADFEAGEFDEKSLQATAIEVNN